MSFSKPLKLAIKVAQIAVTVCAILAFVAGFCVQGAESESEQNSEDSEDLEMEGPDDEDLEEIFSDFEIYTEKCMKDWLVPGLAVAVVKGDRVIYANCFGNKTAEGNDPVTSSTIFQIGSTTKAFTATLVAMLVDEGLVKWDDRVIDHLTEFRMYDPMATREFRVKDLMTHSSGLPEWAGDDLITLGYSPEYEMKALGQIEPAIEFRSGYTYDNAMFLWAAKLVESKTGRTWGECLKERIFQPLSMRSTSSGMESFLESKDSAGLHRLKDDKISSGEVVALPRDWKYMDWVYELGPAGGINSNIEDMARWLALNMNFSVNGTRIVSQSNLEMLHSPLMVVSKDMKLFGGMGWLYEEYAAGPIVWHNGGSFGHHSMVAFIPQKELGIVVLSDSSSGVPELLVYWFFDRYFGYAQRDYSNESLTEWQSIEKLVIANRPEPPVPADPSLPLDRYVGNYSNDLYGSMNLTVDDGRLMATIGPRRLQAFFSHWNRDSFLANVPEFMNKTSTASFVIGPDGKAESVEMLLFIEGERGRSAVFQRAKA